MKLEEVRKYGKTIGEPFCGEARELRSNLVAHLMEYGSFIGLHFSLGMSIRNHLRQNHSEVVDQEREVEHLLDNNWQRILLSTLDLTKEELEKFPLKEWLTSSDDCTRYTALKLKEIYELS